MDKPSSGLGDLLHYLPPIDPKLPKNERTRVTPATFYNHFPSKDDVLGSIGRWVAERLTDRVQTSMAEVTDGAHRMSIGNRRFVLLAMETPGWALLLIQLGATNPDM